MSTDKHRGVPSPSFAALREFARISKKSARLSLLAWPVQTSRTLLFNSGLDSFWNKERLHEIFTGCLEELSAELGPAYNHLFEKFGATLDFDRHIMPLPFEEIRKILDRHAPDWSHEFIVDKKSLFVTTLCQIHAAVDESGKRWFFKIIKPQAKQKLESSINALREIEAVLGAFRFIPKAAAMVTKVEELRRMFQREVDLKFEQRTLERLRSSAESDKQAALRFPAVLTRMSNEDVLVFECMDGFPLNLRALDWKRLEVTRKFNWSAQPIQASVLKAFELGLVRAENDTEKLVMMKDGSIGVRYGWSIATPDGSDRRQAAHLIRALYAGDLSDLKDVLTRGTQAHAKRTAKAFQEKTHEFDRRMGELSSLGLVSFVDRAETTFAYSEGLGLELPKGFMDIAKSLHSLEGIGKPLIVKRSTSNGGPFGYPVRTASQEIILNTPIARARRLYGR
ncbi:MAG: hypothetical protein H7249_13590 [Chitinophagaceae bacterium]|nr:hypothetical protein [Oligoflexus sp.]